MMSYGDRTWCLSPNCQGKCGRQFTAEDRRRAIVWWGSEDFPISVALFCDDNGEVIK